MKGPRSQLRRYRVALAGLTLAAGLGALAPLGAQLRVQTVSDEDGRVALGLLLRKLDNAGTLMMATAHPDDENNGLLALAGHGLGFKTVLATATRGDGGQNEIGPELFDALGVLRTEELLAAHRFDGADQYFTRAVDFGYSFSVEESYERWNRDEILGDYVRLIRMHRPDVILALRPDGTGGGQHHQASARLAREAFRAAADSTKYPDQIAAGLRAWQAKKFYFAAGFGPAAEPPPGAGARTVSVDLGGFDALLGRTYAEIGAEARSMHKCQGMPQLLPTTGQAVARYYLGDSVLPDSSDASLLGDLRTTLPDLVQYAGATPPPDLSQALTAIATHVATAKELLNRDGLDAAAPEIVAGLAGVRALRGAVTWMTGVGEEGRFEIDFRLREKERQFEAAALVAHGLRLDAFADDGVVAPGQEMKLTLLVANRGRAVVNVSGIVLKGFEGVTMSCPARTVKGGEVATCTAAARIPAEAKLTTPYFRRLTDAARYAFEPDAPFGHPFEPTPFAAAFDLDLMGQRVSVTHPVEHRYESDIFAGEKRMDLHVVPELAVRITPEILVFPLAAVRTSDRPGGASRSGAGREVRVTVTSARGGPLKGQVTLDLPAGWSAQPATQGVRFTREDEAQTVRFEVQPPARLRPGDFQIHARVGAGDRVLDRGYQVVEYPHIHRRHLVQEAVTRVKVIDVAVRPGLRVGYVMGVGDEVSAAIRQLGAEVTPLGPDDLAWDDLSPYHTIVLGIRAYERRPDLRAHNARLLHWVEQGGTLIVQYNRAEFNQASYGPYPVEVGNQRVTDETAPVRLLVPDHPVFMRPNAIDASAWEGWVQERGLYFLDKRDARYVDLIAMEDPFEYNRGEKRGALVEARYGKGRWIYVGLGLWRQLPAGTGGAYRLLANLISLS